MRWDANTAAQLHARIRALVETRQHYARELGYTLTPPSVIVGMNTSIDAGESIEVAIPTENGQLPVVIAIGLHSNGDIRLLPSDESFLATPHSIQKTCLADE